MGKELFRVERILERRINPTTGKKEYMIKWKGYPYTQCTWQPQEHLRNVFMQVLDFNRKQNKKTQNSEKTHKINKLTHNKQVVVKVQKEQGVSLSGQIQKAGTKKALKEASQKVTSRINQNSVKIQNLESKELEHKSQKIGLAKQEQECKIAKEDKVDNLFVGGSSVEEIEVIQIAQNCKGELFFCLKFPQSLRWVPHKVMKSEYQLELIDFYEKHMTFENIQERQSAEHQI